MVGCASISGLNTSHDHYVMSTVQPPLPCDQSRTSLDKVQEAKGVCLEFQSASALLWVTSAVQLNSHILWSTQDQYVFIHDAVLESLTCGDTQIPASGLSGAIKKVTVTHQILALPLRNWKKKTVKLGGQDLRHSFMYVIQVLVGFYITQSQDLWQTNVFAILSNTIHACSGLSTVASGLELENKERSKGDERHY